MTTAEQMRLACAGGLSGVRRGGRDRGGRRLPARRSRTQHKQKKDVAPLVIELERTADILAELAAQKDGRFVIGFAAETRDVLPEAAAQARREAPRPVVANDVSESGLGFSADENRVWMVTADSVEEMPVMSKTRIAAELWERFAPAARRAAERRRKGEDRETPAGGSRQAALGLRRRGRDV